MFQKSHGVPSSAFSISFETRNSAPSFKAKKTLPVFNTHKPSTSAVKTSLNEEQTENESAPTLLQDPDQVPDATATPTNSAGSVESLKLGEPLVEGELRKQTDTALDQDSDVLADDVAALPAAAGLGGAPWGWIIAGAGLVVAGGGGGAGAAGGSGMQSDGGGTEPPRVSGLTFKLHQVNPLPDAVVHGFEQAAAVWSSLLQDDVLISLDINFAPIVDTIEVDQKIIGKTVSAKLEASYTDVHTALLAEPHSESDNLAVASLDPGDSFGLLINRTANNPNGRGSSLAYVDNNSNANNQRIELTRANAKALRLVDGDDVSADASISFNSLIDFDFDRSDGIDAQKFDFVGVAIHEIGHVLGFSSGVDVLDRLTNFLDAFYTSVSPLDLFRYSAASADVGVIDWTASASDKYFSLDRGKTKIASFSTGINFGDGQQASHWKDQLGLGAMDPTLRNGEQLTITALDLSAFDVIGWDLSNTSAQARVL